MDTRSDTTMTIRMNRKIKQEAQEVFAALGVDMTTAINVFLRQSIYHKGFPFDVRLDVPNAETLEALREVEQMKSDPSVGKSYTDIDEMMKELLS